MKKKAPKPKKPDDPPTALVRRARRIYRALTALYPDAHCELDHRNAYELLMATILSAQCTDVRVNLVTPALFKRYPAPRDLADARQADVEELIRSTGFYRNKAKSLISASTDIVAHHDGDVPQAMDPLLSLHGVARKTANVVLGNAFNRNEGVVVDTHVGRLARRMGLTQEENPVKVEKDLMRLIPRKNWCMLSHLLIFHGRRVCSARKPDCAACTLRKDCPRTGVPTD